MIFQEWLNGKLIITETKAEEELLIKFSIALGAYNFDKTPTVQRTKLKALWLKMEYAAKEKLLQSMGVKREQVFECNEED